MHKLYELKDKLIGELEDYSENGKYSKEDVEAIKYMASAVDHICNIMEDVGAEEGYSGEGGMNRTTTRIGNRGGSYRGGYEGGMSYARGRGRNARRDSRGRYSSEYGYSRAAEDMASQLREMAQDAPDEQSRMDIERLAKRMESMM
jgi:hypothetical protein